MPRIERTAEVSWEGNLARGTGHISAGSGAFGELPYSLATRIAQPEGRTSPEELLAAAHAACLTMSLAGELTQAGTPPRRLDASCLIVMDEVEGKGHLVVASELRVRADVPGLEAAILDEAVARADAGCPISTLIRGTATVELAYELV